MTAGTALDIGAAHAAIQDAIDAGEPGGLRVLGYGEITLVVGWPSASPAWALKRLPPFASRVRLDAYAALVADYLDALAEREVATAPTRLEALPGARGTWYAYLVQPIAPPGRVLDQFLAGAAPEDGRAALARVVAAIVRGVDERVALDGQISNWQLGEGGAPLLLDLSTPMLRDAGGRDRIDAELFTSVYPWVLRGALRRFVAPSILRGYHDPRTNLTDAAANLLRQNLDAWVPVLLEVAREATPQAPSLDDVRRYHRTDTLLWATTERLRRSERWWQRRVRRRPYPMLLAPPGAIRPKRTGGPA